ncbi:MAG: ribosomal protein S18-alanine N-acetyltransferase [Anaerolineae bacterium]
MDLSGLPYALDSMRLEDVPAVATIEKQVFATPWSAEAFRQEITYHAAATYLVLRYTDQPAIQQRFPRRPWTATQDPGLVGYGGLWLVMEQAHVSTLAVRPLWRGRGLGELLFAALIGKALESGCDELTLEVRVSNRTAQNLYAKYGLEVTGRRTRYYPDNLEDAWIMSSPLLRGDAYRKAYADLIERLRVRLLEAPTDIPDVGSLHYKESQA